MSSAAAITLLPSLLQSSAAQGKEPETVQAAAQQAKQPAAHATPAYTVSLSQEAQVGQMSLQGDSPSQIALDLNISVSLVDLDLGIVTQAATAPVAATPAPTHASLTHSTQAQTVQAQAAPDQTAPAKPAETKAHTQAAA